MTLPELGNLAVCNEHGVMTHSKNSAHGVCPLCKLDVDVEVRREDEISGGKLSGQEIRRRLESEDIQELLPLMREYLDDRTDGDDEGDLWVTVVEVKDGQLPAGYSSTQERWANVIGYTLAGRKKFITQTDSLQETISSLRENGYGSETDVTRRETEGEQ